MPGRSSSCLLAVSLLMLVSSSLTAQRSDPDLSTIGPRAEELAARLPGIIQPPSPLIPAPPPIVPRYPIRTPVMEFPGFTRAAGMIFSGTVKSIERRPATRAQAVETVAVTFHVENAIRGVTPGEDLTIFQWIGLWSSGQRYRVGEQLLLFLYPPSKLGLTSCVAGSMGRFTMDAQGRVLLSAQHLSAFRQDPVLGGKSRVRFRDFTRAVLQAGEEE